MQCPKCHQTNASNARFCAYCGAMLPDDDDDILRPGQTLSDGVYRILRPLGRGGMGAVYLAANTRAFDRPCVIKEIIEYYDPADVEARQKAIQRFEAEARTLAALRHSSIPDIYAYFSEHNHNYLVMEYIEGPNLSENLTRKESGKLVAGQPQPAGQVINHVIEICEVLDYLAQQQPPVIHNDIKPANIILEKSTGRAVLVDFGTAKYKYSLAESPPAHMQPGRLQSSVYGTLGYAAPELFEGQGEPRSDVYGLAATAYHLLTDDDPREHPFKYPHMDEIAPSLRDVLDSALAVNAADRPSAAELRQQLLRLVNGEQQPAGTQIQVLTPELSYAPERADQDSQDLVLTNPGESRLVGTVTAQQPWIRVQPEFRCAPGGTVSLPVKVNVSEMEPGQIHRGEIVVKTEHASSSTVSIEVRVPVPSIQVTPMQIDLGTVSRRDLFTARKSFQVRNTGISRASCYVKSLVPWLVLDPVEFTCLPGQSRTIELTGRTDLIPRDRERHETTLEIAIQGRHSRQVKVTARLRERGRQTVSVIGVGLASLVLLAAIVWFVLTVLPLI